MPYPSDSYPMARLTLLFFGLYLAALTWPGYLLFRGIEPSILGFPLSFAWVILWVVLGWIMLTCQYFADVRRRS